MSKIKLVFRRIAGRILEMDDTVVPYEQLDILNDFLSRHQFEFDDADIASILKGLKRKHLVDSISVVDKDGQMVITSEGNGNSEVDSLSALLRYIDSELATPESVMIKAANNWFMLFPFNQKTYVVKAQASLSNVELKALAKELESFMVEKQKTTDSELAVL